MIALTGATGQLGRLVLAELLQQVPAASIVAVVRDPAKAADLASQGVQIRAASYDEPAALRQAFAGVDNLLLISSSEIGQRIAQHRNVIAAAVDARVSFLTYTSLLHADRSPLNLAAEHRTTEADLRASGLPFVILRNGWYTENYTASLPAALAHGAFVGSAGEGRISLAARADYAAAAATALLSRAEAGRTYELAGDQAVTLGEFAAALSRQVDRPIPYVDLPVEKFVELLRQAGLPEALANGFPQWDFEASRGALFDDSGELSTLIGRPTTPVAETLRAELARTR